MKQSRIVFPLFLVIFFVAKSSFALDCRSAEVAFYFGNGMFNDRYDANESALALEDFLYQNQFIRGGQKVHLAYNLNESALVELLQVATQKSEEYGRSFFQWLSDLSLAKDDFRILAFAVSRSYDKLRYVSDQDLKSQVAAYRTDIAAGKTVLVVAHSQGNFYANSAWHLIQGLEGAAGRFFVVGAAAPVNSIAGGGPYATLTQDLVIKAVRTAFSALPANVTNLSASPSGHEFVSQYLNGDQSGPKIMADVGETMSRIGDAFTTVGKKALEYQDPSLWPFMRYACALQASPSRLTDAQCIALAALDRTYAWFGEPKEKRSVKSLIEWIDRCDGDDYWHDPDRFDFLDCSLLGDRSGFDLRGRGQGELDFAIDGHPECHWRGKEVGRRATPTVVEEARALLRAPPKAKQASSDRGSRI
jgi:hypothetical protein